MSSEISLILVKHFLSNEWWKVPKNFFRSLSESIDEKKEKKKKKNGNCKTFKYTLPAAFSMEKWNNYHTNAPWKNKLINNTQNKTYFLKYKLGFLYYAAPLNEDLIN